jgi:hypothetical protein
MTLTSSDLNEFPSVPGLLCADAIAWTAEEDESGPCWVVLAVDLEASQARCLADAPAVAEVAVEGFGGATGGVIEDRPQAAEVVDGSPRDERCR